MSTNNIYKVTFKGVILPGFDKHQVIDNIHNISRIPKHTISRKFFSGKTVVIRHAENIDYARQLQATFSYAGIETYIQEFPAASQQEKFSAPGSEQAIEKSLDTLIPPSSTSKNTNRLKLLSAFAIIILSIFSTLIFLKDNTPPADPVVHQSDINSAAGHTTLTSLRDTAETIPGEPETKKTGADSATDTVSQVTDYDLPDFLNQRQLDVFIKFTDQHSLNKLSQFILLADINPLISSFIKQQLNDNKQLIISAQQPLYIYKSKEHSGILINKQADFSAADMRQLEDEIAHLTNISGYQKLCAQSAHLKIINMHNHLLFTARINGNDLKLLTGASKAQQLNHNLRKLDRVFYAAKNHETTMFNFYYAHQEQPSAADTLQSFFSISANDKAFYIQTNNSAYQNILSDLHIDTAGENKLSVLASLNLFKLSLLALTKNKSKYSFNNNQLTDNFKAEYIVPINDKYTLDDIKAYQNELDIEFNTQWQAGPFAIGTRQFRFNKNLIVELQAKGQNISNLLEYSHSSTFITHLVTDKAGNNILLDQCLKLSADNYYFKDFEGPLEAYINDEFVRYQSISASNNINIKPGYSSQDIQQIKGKINLQLPVEIFTKRFKPADTFDMISFKHFTVLIDAVKRDNVLEYKIMGDKKYFLSLRAYNQSKEPINSVTYKHKSFFNEQLNVHQQIFAEKIHSFKILYTEDIQQKTYAFSLKPEISPKFTALETQDKPFTVFTDESALFNTSLSANILNDNPQWLGQRAAKQSFPPFYISLFVRDTDGTSLPAETIKQDAVFNIKTAVSVYLQQNLTAVKVTLYDNKSKLLDNFVSFSLQELFEGENISQGEITPYLNANTAFQVPAARFDQFHGQITLTLPTGINSHSSKYHSLGQVIKFADIAIIPVQLDQHQLKFSIKGNIKKLLQVKLYNKNKELVSDVLEFKVLAHNSALLTLRYNDNFEQIRIIASDSVIEKHYPFDFSQ